MHALLDEWVRVYRASLKPHDLWWNVRVARPLAAPVVWALARTSATPNQVTLAGFGVFLVALALLAALPTAWGWLLAMLVLQTSYVLDCADGQLARLTGRTSEAGAYLDFLVDEFKALGLVIACALRLWRLDPTTTWPLLLGLAAAALVAVATSLTTFARRPEVAGHAIPPGVIPPPPEPATRPIRRALQLAQHLARVLMHYPSWIHLTALAALHPELPDPALIFMTPYVALYALYIVRSMVGLRWLARGA